MKRIDATQLVLPRVAELAGYVPGEQPGDASGLIKLNTNENPYPAAPGVSAAVTAAAKKLRLYPEPMADSLRVLAAERYGVHPDSILVGNGSDELLAIVLRACIGPQDGVAYGVPSYSLYRTLTEIVGGRAVEFPIERDGEVEPGPESAVARVVFLCTPNSPFGASLDAATIESVLDAANGLVVVDEAYGDFGGSSALPLLERFENLVVTRSFSKSFSLAGARLGLAFAAPALIAEFAKVKDSYNVSRLSLAAGQAALEDYSWMQSNVSRILATRDRVIGALTSHGWAIPPTDANFFWLDCRDRGGGERIYRKLRSAGVLVRWFDRPDLRHGTRVTVGTDAEMDRFLEALLRG